MWNCRSGVSASTLSNAVSTSVAYILYIHTTTKLKAIIGVKQAKGFIQGPSPRRTKDLLKLNRDQLR
jgi:hypothetical protein